MLQLLVELQTQSNSRRSAKTYADRTLGSPEGPRHNESPDDTTAKEKLLFQQVVCICANRGDTFSGCHRQYQAFIHIAMYLIKFNLSLASA